MLLGCSTVSTIGLLLVFWVWKSFGGGAIWVQRFGVNSFVQTIRSAFVQQIELAEDALSVEELLAVERHVLFEGLGPATASFFF